MSHLNHVVVGAALAAACVVAPTRASASIIEYLSQERSVHARLDDLMAGYVGTASESATNFDRFNTSVSVDSTTYGPGTATARQDSTLDPDTGITLVLAVSGFGSANYMQTPSGSSQFDVEFEIFEPIMAMVTLNWGYDVCMLYGPGLDLGIDHWTQQSFGPALVLLQPGVYTMEGSVLYTGGGFGGSGEMVFGSVIVPSVGGAPAVFVACALALRRRRVET